MMFRRHRLSAQPFSPEDFQIIERVGSGAFGTVVACVQGDKVVALKILEKKTILKQGLARQTRLEREVLRKIKHPFVCSMRFAFQTPNRLYFGMSLYCGSLASHEAEPALAVAEIAAGISHLHSRGIIHRDLKTTNVLVDSQGHLAVSDFGLAVPGGKTRGFAGTVEYAAPELLKGDVQTRAIDYWSLGILAYELVEGVTPFRGRKARELFLNILRKDPKPPRQLKELILGLLDKNPTTRLVDLESQFDFPALIAKELPPPVVRPNLRPYIDKNGFFVVGPPLSPMDTDDTSPHRTTSFRGFASPVQH